MIVLEFEKEHLEGVVLKGDNIDKFEQYLDYFEENYTLTFMDEDGVLGFLGIVIDDKAGIVWLVPTENLSERKVDFVRTVKNYIEKMKDLFGVEKLVTSCNGTTKIVRWLTYLGFSPVDDGSTYERCL